MERTIKTRYHSTDELLDILRNKVDYEHHNRLQIINALDALGEECDDEEWDDSMC